MSSRVVERQPRLSLTPPVVESDGDDAAFLSSSYGLTPDPWQKDVLDCWLGRRLDGRWASLTCGLSIPRQNGKNGVIEMRELFGMVQLGERFLHTAHEVKTARKAFLRLCSFFENPRRYPELAELLDGAPRKTNGQEAIFLSNGGSVEFIARSKSSGRGYTVDTLVMDEAQELSEEALEALIPTTSASPLRNPQWIFTGTPPGPAADGAVFTRVRRDGVAGDEPRLTWHEWSAGSVDDIDEHQVWRDVNPALGSRLQWEVVESERSRFSNDGFCRERLGMWSETQGNSVIDEVTWQSLAGPDSAAEDPVAYAIDVSPDRERASIGMAGWRADGRLLVEYVDRRRSVDWVVAVAAKITEKQRPRGFVVDRGSPAGSLIPALLEAKVPLIEIGAVEHGRAFGRFYDSAMSGLLVHLDQPELNVALAGARKRPIGTEGAYGWNRKDNQTDITPLVAVTLAIHGLAAEAKNEPKKLSRLYAF